MESGGRYKVIEDGLGTYMLEVRPSESCDEGEWKCVVTSSEGVIGISTATVAMDSEFILMYPFKELPLNNLLSFSTKELPEASFHGESASGAHRRGSRVV